ncbi:tyrosine--tRNA ligase [Eubacterium ruminantium]|uniref:tyrosine--tRNA ligase n=1 Tax=Eubacterium ruminantium TaxID=42322 RepID=UPI002479064E|nr:tyrosine--tRNA ligase [Eubacterium ruminantium]
MELYEELVARGLIAQVTNEEEIKKLINTGKATFYIGFDPTADSLHVGHFMALCLMKRLQEGGNKPIALVGGGTGMIGDPSGRTDMRLMMTKETIDHNCECFKKQMSRFIDFSEGKALMVNNADWLMDLNYIEFIRDIGSQFSVNKMLAAECYKQRLERGLNFLEFNYMLMQSYDFLMLYEKYGCNLEFGGDDQWSNMLGGTELIRKKLGKDAHAMTITLLLNSEGKKMGKTAKGAVWLDPNKTSPFDFYQYWRNVDDKDVIKCLKMLTFLPIEEIQAMEVWEGAELNKAKEILAYELTKLVHGEEEAEKAQSAAKNIFSAGFSENMPETSLSDEDFVDGKVDLIGILVKAGLVKSRSEGRRAIEQGGVVVNDEKIVDVYASYTKDAFGADFIVRRGKKNFRKITL